MIKIYKQYEYKGCPIIIRQTDRKTYEYMLVKDGKFYGTFIQNKLKWNQLHRIFWREMATDREVNGMIHFLQKAAETTCDTLDKKKELEKKDENKSNN